MISVIIPTYNQASYLKEAIQSVLSQTYQDFEIIVIDDGSTDNTFETVQTFKSNKLIYHFQNNSGVNRSRNKGIDIARGEYVAFLDHDDIWHPSKLEIQYSCMKRHPEVDFIFSNFNALVDETQKVIPSYIKRQYSIFSTQNLSFENIFEFKEDLCSIDGKGIVQQGNFYWGNILPTLLLGNYALNPSRLIRRNALERIKGFSEKFPLTDDYEAVIRLAKNGLGGYIDVPLLNYRIRTNSLSHSHENQISKWKESLEIVEAALKDSIEVYRKNPKRYDRKIATFHNEIASLYEMDRNRTAAVLHWHRSLDFDPKNPVAFLGLIFGRLFPPYHGIKKALKSGIRLFARQNMRF